MCLFKLPFLYSLSFLSYFFLMSYMKHFVFCCWKVLEKYNTNILKLKPNVKLSKHSFSLILSLPKIRLALGIGSHFIKLLLFGGAGTFLRKSFACDVLQGSAHVWHVLRESSKLKFALILRKSHMVLYHCVSCNSLIMHPSIRPVDPGQVSALSQGCDLQTTPDPNKINEK